jgi:3-phytase/alkaline phosphatase D
MKTNSIMKTNIEIMLLLAACSSTSGVLLSQTPELPNRVAAGDVTTSRAVLWSRSSVTGNLTFSIADNPAMVGALTRTVFVVDPLVPAKAAFGGLNPATQYYYTVTSPSGGTDSGTLKTASASSSIQGLRFGVSGDSRGDLMPFNSITNASTSGLDFFVMLGDTIYADVASPVLPGVAQCQTLTEFSLKHSEVLTGSSGLNAIADLRRSTSLWATIDDHEVTNDFSGGAAPASDPRFDNTGAFINETFLYGTGMRAFLNYQPVYRTFYGATGDARTANKRKLYRKQRYGGDAAIFVTDARSFRDVGLPPVTNPNDPAQVTTFLINSFNPARTMLGRAQVDELKSDLLAAEAQGTKWKFVMVPEPIQNLGVFAASDRFEGYAAERTELLAFIQTNNIKNVVFVAADIHGTLVNNLTYQTGPGQPQVLTGAFEITTGAIAYNAPFGPTVAGIAAQLGLITPAQYQTYLSLPTAFKDVFVQQLVDAQVTPFGYDTLGLSGSPINATLLAGGYTATHVYGWTEFEIAPATGVLTVTTWGVDPASPGAAPSVQSRFQVTPQ